MAESDAKGAPLKSSPRVADAIEPLPAGRLPRSKPPVVLVAYVISKI
jgi:hypothetical protein